MLRKINKGKSYILNRRLRSHYPQFERSPEPFPSLTIYPDGWDMSEIPESQPTLPEDLAPNQSGKEPLNNG